MRYANNWLDTQVFDSKKVILWVIESFGLKILNLIDLFTVRTCQMLLNRLDCALGVILLNNET